MAKVLSIEIGSSFTKVAEVDYKTKKAKIHDSFVIQTPPDMVSPEGEVAVSDVFTVQLQTKLQEHKMNTKNVVFVVNAARVVSRTIVIPAMKENRVHDYVMSNASDYFPYSLNGYEVSCDIDGQLEDNGVKKLQVTVNCMPSSIVGSYEQVTKALGLNLIGLDHSGNAIKKMMMNELPEELKITFKMEENTTIITVVENNKIQFQRTANYGVDDILEEIKRSDLFGTNLSDLDALGVVSRKTLVFKHLDDTTGDVEEGDSSLDQVKLQQLKRDITSGLSPLVGNITKILDVYTRDKDLKNADVKIYLVGIGSYCSGLSKLLSNELGLKVVSQQSFGTQLLGEKAENSSLAAFFSVCGAAMEPIGIVFQEKKGEKRSAKGNTSVSANKESLLAPLLVMLLCILTSIGLVVFSTLTFMAAKSENARLQAEVTRLQPAQDVYDEFVATNATYNDILLMVGMTETPNDVFLEFLDELEACMPQDGKILDMSASTEGITMSVTTGSKESAAKLIVGLRSFATIHGQDTASISEETDDSGVVTVNFAIATYFEDPNVQNQPVVQPEASEETTTE